MLIDVARLKPLVLCRSSARAHQAIGLKSLEFHGVGAARSGYRDQLERKRLAPIVIDASFRDNERAHLAYILPGRALHTTARTSWRFSTKGATRAATHTTDANAAAEAKAEGTHPYPCNSGYNSANQSSSSG
jgi:hypothetical protein